MDRALSIINDGIDLAPQPKILLGMHKLLVIKHKAIPNKS